MTIQIGKSVRIFTIIVVSILACVNCAERRETVRANDVAIGVWHVVLLHEGSRAQRPARDICLTLRPTEWENVFVASFDGVNSNMFHIEVRGSRLALACNEQIAKCWTTTLIGVGGQNGFDEELLQRILSAPSGWYVQGGTLTIRSDAKDASVEVRR